MIHGNRRGAWSNDDVPFYVGEILGELLVDQRDCLLVAFGEFQFIFYYVKDGAFHERGHGGAVDRGR